MVKLPSRPLSELSYPLRPISNGVFADLLQRLDTHSTVKYVKHQQSDLDYLNSYLRDVNKEIEHCESEIDNRSALCLPLVELIGYLSDLKFIRKKIDEKITETKLNGHGIFPDEQEESYGC